MLTYTDKDNRTYQVELMDSNKGNENLRKHMVANGFDGNVYIGVSAPTGRQRKTIQRLFVRRASGLVEPWL